MPARKERPIMIELINMPERPFSADGDARTFHMVRPGQIRRIEADAGSTEIRYYVDFQEEPVVESWADDAFYMRLEQLRKMGFIVGAQPEAEARGTTWD